MVLEEKATIESQKKEIEKWRAFFEGLMNFIKNNQ